jgi:hypothetical protein
MEEGGDLPKDAAPYRGWEQGAQGDNHSEWNATNLYEQGKGSFSMASRRNMALLILS